MNSVCNETYSYLNLIKFHFSFDRFVSNIVLLSKLYYKYQTYSEYRNYSHGKKSVSKQTCYIFNLLFHSLYLSGLIWQVTQISVNFFKFDVIEDINVIAPKENTQMEKILYFCFENYQILQNDKYKNILIQKYKKNLKTIKYKN